MEKDLYADGWAAGRLSAHQDRQAVVLDLLNDVSDFLDNYVDVLDGDYGEPRPNRAMSLKARVDELL